MNKFQSNIFHDKNATLFDIHYTVGQKDENPTVEIFRDISCKYCYRLSKYLPGDILDTFSRFLAQLIHLLVNEINVKIQPKFNALQNFRNRVYLQF